MKGSVFWWSEHDTLMGVTDLHWDLLVIDEAHEGVDTFKTDQAFNKIRRNFTLHLSGTSFKALEKGDFTETNLQLVLCSWAEAAVFVGSWAQEEENPYESLPLEFLFTSHVSHMIGEKLKRRADRWWKYWLCFWLKWIFRYRWYKGKFIHEHDVRNWLDTLSSRKISPFSTKAL